MRATSRRTATFTESMIREMTRVARQHDAINLSQGFPDGDPPPALVQAAQSASSGPETHVYSHPLMSVHHKE